MTAAEFWRAACAAIPCGETDLPFSLALRVVTGEHGHPHLVIVLRDHDKTVDRILPDVLQVEGEARDVEIAVRNAGGFPAVYREAIRWVMRAVLDAAGPLRVVSIDLGPGGN